MTCRNVYCKIFTYFFTALPKSAAGTTSPAILSSNGASTPLIFTKTVFSKGPGAAALKPALILSDFAAITGC